VSDGHWLWENDKGRVEAKQIGPRFATIELVGRADDVAAPTIDEALKQLAPVEGVELWWDASRLESFGSTFRSVATDHIMRNRKTVRTIAILTDSALIAMAVSATNLALGGIIVSYRDRDKFDRDLRAAAMRQGVALDKLAG
jgi:hypothetical protein